jgi:hypothetical protein
MIWTSTKEQRVAMRKLGYDWRNNGTRERFAMPVREHRGRFIVPILQGKHQGMWGGRWRPWRPALNHIRGFSYHDDRDWDTWDVGPYPDPMMVHAVMQLMGDPK